MTIFVLYACVLAVWRERDTILAHLVSIPFRIVGVYFFGLGFVIMYNSLYADTHLHFVFVGLFEISSCL